MIKEGRKAFGEERLLAVGIITKPHGINGSVAVEVMSDYPERFLPGSELILETSESTRKTILIETSFHSKGCVVLKLSGVNGRDEAEQMRNNLLFIPESKAFPLEEGEFWVHDLMGMMVSGVDGNELGEVTDVLCRSAQDLLKITGKDGSEFQLPLVKTFIENIDLEGRKITVKLIKGMIS